jgi:hypothetical protein
VNYAFARNCAWAEVIVQLYCVKCQFAISGKMDCPRCGSRLVAPQEAHVLPSERISFVPQATNSSAASRVLAGGAVAFGLAMGLKEVVTGIHSAIGESDEWWSTETAIGVMLSIRALAAVGGGLLAGAGRTNGGLSGMMAGVSAAGILLSIQAFGPNGKVTPESILALAIMSCVALLAGAIGGKVWPPRSELPKATLASRGSSILEKAKDLQEDDEAQKVRPTQWARILLGVSIAICGFVAAESIRTGLVKGSDGLLDLGGSRNLPFTCMEIAGILAFLGGIAAGSSTGIGYRQGIYTGIIAGTLAASLFSMKGPDKFPASAGVMEVLNWSPEKTPKVRAIGTVFGAMFGVCAAGGIFGGLLFPPIVQRQRILTEVDQNFTS